MKTQGILKSAMAGVLSFSMLILSACGGPAPTPGLSVDPKAQTLNAGGAAVDLNATLANSSAPITWSLSPSLGTLSATTGAKVSYTPPATVAADTAVTLTASAGGLSDSATLTVKRVVPSVVADGRLEFTVTAPGGLGGFAASLSVTGPNGFNQTVSGAQALSLAPGRYSVTLRDVRTAGAVADTVSHGTFTAGGKTASVDIEPNKTSSLSLTYTPYATTGKLWALDFSGNGGRAFGDAALAGLLSGNAGALASSGAVTGGSLNASSGALDAGLNLWMAQADELVQFSATDLSVLRRIGLQTASSAFQPGGMAFDAGGNLWLVEGSAQRRLVGYKRADLEALPVGPGKQTLAPSASINLFNVSALSGLALDAAGNAWIGDVQGAKLYRLEASRLAQALNTPTGLFNVVPDQTISNQTNALPGLARSLDFPTGLAFDRSGSLWVANSGFGSNPPSLVRFNPQTGAVTFAILGAPGNPIGLAFDNAGNLWGSSFAGGKSVVFKYNTGGLSATPATLQSAPFSSFETGLNAVSQGLVLAPR